MHTLLRAVLMLVAVGAGGLVHAQAWPTKPVKLVVAFAPGAQPDVIGRLLADRLTRVLGQQVIVENRPGASNLIGAQAVARAPADGYTFFFGTSAALITNPLLFKSLPYDPLRDFTPVAFVGKSPFFVLAHPDLPVVFVFDVKVVMMVLEPFVPTTVQFVTTGPMIGPSNEKSLFPEKVAVLLVPASATAEISSEPAKRTATLEE